MELMEEQKNFIRNNFSLGEELFDRVEAFITSGDLHSIVIRTKDNSAIHPWPKNLRDMDAFPQRAFIVMGKERR